MRVGLVIEHFDPRRGGAEQWTCQWAEQLLARGHQVHVLARRFAADQGLLPSPARGRGAGGEGAGGRRTVVTHELLSVGGRLAFAAAAETQLRTLDLDVVHDMGAGWSGDVLLSHDGSRLALWERKLALLPAWARPLKRAWIRLAPRYRAFRRLAERQFGDDKRIVVAISQMVADDYCRYHGVPAQRIRLIYHGIDTERFSPERCRPLRDEMRRQLGLAEHETVFLFAGHDFHRKGLATLLRAVGRLAAERQPVRLLVLGGRHAIGQIGNLPHGPLARLARRCGADHCVTFLGPHDDPVPYYAAADALVLPSYYDPFGLVVLEAAACGLPAIASRLCGVSELLSNGTDGFVLDDPADDATLAAQLRSLLETDVRQRLGAAARALSLRHTLERNCEEMLAVYEEVVGKRGHSTFCLAEGGCWH